MTIHSDYGNHQDKTGEYLKTNVQTQDGGLKMNVESLRYARQRQYEYVYLNIVFIIVIHTLSLYVLCTAFMDTKWQTDVWAFLCYLMSGFGVTVGVHRLWSHKSFQAKWPLRLTLMLWNTMAFQGPVINWARDHRVHHKCSDTDADPYNATRGFFFCHVGWLCCRKNEEVKEKGRTIDMTDLEMDPILSFQQKYYVIIVPIFCFIIPTIVPVFFWNETWTNAFLVPTIFRYTFALNATWCVNSFAHLFGGRPYDKDLNPRENIGVACLTLGEGWHNYHHTFPWDYKTAELPFYTLPNPSTAFIDFMAFLGQAYDLKTVSSSMVESRVKRTGDGSHALWGWDDLVDDEKKNVAAVKNKLSL